MENKFLSRLSKASLGGGITFISSVGQIAALLLKLVLGLIVLITNAINQKNAKKGLTGRGASVIINLAPVCTGLTIVL